MEVTDAYTEYVKARRENANTVKMCTLTLPQEDMAGIGSVISNAVEETHKELEPATLRRWDRILRAIARSVQEAE